jgi:hypothetical protein
MAAYLTFILAINKEKPFTISLPFFLDSFDESLFLKAQRPLRCAPQVFGEIGEQYASFFSYNV